jgi:predicted negative regulator of RcsB-dependent stress response
MKKYITTRFSPVLFLTLIAFSAFSQGITSPRTPSPASTVSQTIGISTVTVKYSRPKVNNRVIWGELVPYGWNVQSFGNNASAPWRAGANENTVIELSHDATIEGQPVPKGSYGLFFVINQDNTGEVILSKDFRSWGSFFYDASKDQVRTKIQLRDIPMTELLTYDFINLTKTSAELVLNWEKKQFPIKVEFAVDNIVMANAAEELKGPVGFNAQAYVSAANYALQNNVNQEQALKWIDQAITQNKTFTALRVKSELLRKSGKTEDADKLITEALGLATENEINIYGYQLMGQGNVDKAIEMLTLNTQKFPKSANAWDSLGEAYATKGDKANAIKNFKKSLSMNPAPGVKANSEKFLKQLGAM